MTNRRRVPGWWLRTTSTWSCLVLVPLSAGAQSSISQAEAAQLYTAAGFRIVRDQPVNRCGRPAKPRVTFVDINGDRRPEALFVDEDGCYVPSGRYFAVLAKEGTAWRPLISGTGSIQALSTKTAGWLDMRVTESGCVTEHRYGGRGYVGATDCSGRTVGAPAQPAPRTAAQAALPAPAQPAARAAGTALPAADEAAAFKAAGFTRRGGAWRNCDAPAGASATPGSIEQTADLNGDGLPEVVITEGGTYCYGNTGQGFWLVSKLAGGSWKVMASGTGIPQFLGTKGADGWPDVSVGGPGFCFPVERWNGKAYKLQRWEYEGKACKPPR